MEGKPAYQWTVSPHRHITVDDAHAFALSLESAHGGPVSHVLPYRRPSQFVQTSANEPSKLSFATIACERSIL